MKVERAKIQGYAAYLKDKYRPPSKGGITRAWHQHWLTIEGERYSFLALGSRRWVYATDTVSFDWEWDPTQRWRNIKPATLQAFDKNGRPVERGLRGGKPWRTADARPPAARREWRDCRMRLYVFADEAGDYAFVKNGRASKYFILCTVTLEFCNSLSAALLNLRREMIWVDDPVGPFFHCSEDKQAVRDKVFALLKIHPFDIQATVMEKVKAQPQTRTSKYRFYQYAWYHHLKYAAPKFVGSAKEIQITTATAGVKNEQPKFSHAVNDVAQQTMGERKWKTAFCPSMADPMLQVVDYCTWAIQRKWERGDTKSYDLIKHRITHEVDMWERGTKLYY